jgi:hypothetical protein
MSYFTPEIHVVNEETKKIFADSTKQCIIACHPHGVFSYNHFLFMTDSCGFMSKIYKVSTMLIPVSRLIHTPHVLCVCCDHTYALSSTCHVWMLVLTIDIHMCFVCAVKIHN